MSELRKQFSKRLKTLREDRGLTQEELAKALDLSASFVSSLERAIDAPSFETLEKLAKVLSVHVKDLFDFDSNTI